jgi:tetratricopeptide (TPR) repeat protein
MLASVPVLITLVLWAAPGAHQDARAAWQAGRRAEAIELCEAELARQPADAALRRELVAWELTVHRYAKALEHMQPLGPEADPERGYALYRSSRFEEALPYLRGDDTGELLMRMDALEALGRMEELDRAVERAMQEAPLDPRVQGFVGRWHLWHDRPAEAAAVFRATLAAAPRDPTALFGLGRALIALGERDEGLRVLAEHRRLTPLVDQLEFALRGLDLDPLSAPNQAAVGDAERALGETQRAEAAYRRAAELARGADVVPIALRHARLLHEDRADTDAALALLADAARRVDPPGDARLFVRAGDLLLGAGRAAEAQAEFERARALRPNDAAVAERLAAALRAQGR